MPKTLTTAASTKALTPHGTEPISIIRVDWSSGTKYYGDKSFTLGSLTVLGILTNASSINASIKTNVVGEVSSIQVVLKDSDETLKTLVDQEILEGTPAVVYQHFTGNTQADLVTVLKGKLVADITWNEGNREFSFGIESVPQSETLGFSPEAGDVENLSKEAEGQTWPMCFGGPLHVPAVRVHRRAVGKLTKGYSMTTTMEIDGGDLFPQGESVEIVIHGMKYTGTFNGNIFTVATSNLAEYENVSFLSRPNFDKHYFDASVAWVPETVVLNGLFVLVNDPEHGWEVNYCVEQEGPKCYFAQPWPRLQHSSHTINEVAVIPRNTWPVSFGLIERQFGKHWLWMDFNRVGMVNPVVLLGKLVIKGYWQHPAGAKVFLTNNYPDKYVANTWPSNEIRYVGAYRQYKGQRIFAPIPKRYYTVNLAESIGGQTATTLTFEVPLEERRGEEWDGDIYVSLRSSIGNNAATVIKYIIENYTDLTVDATAFNATRDAVWAYPVNFAFLTEQDALKAVELVAFQARIGVSLRNGVAYLNYLSKIPVSARNVDDTDVEYKSLELTFMPTEELATRYEAIWRKDYLPEDDSEFKIIYRNNEDQFGIQEREDDFVIYNVGSLVEKSLYWWGYRFSHLWRRMSCNLFLDHLAVDTFDIVRSRLLEISGNNLRGVCTQFQHDTAVHLIAFSAELASKSGDYDSAGPVEDLAYWHGNLISEDDVTPADPISELEEVDYVVPVEPQPGEDPEKSDPETPTRRIEIIVNEPTLPNAFVERTVPFPVRIRLFDLDGNLVNANATITLGLAATGHNFSPVTVGVFNGEGTFDITITGSSGEFTGAYMTASSGHTYIGGSSNLFRIIDERDEITWVVSPGDNIDKTEVREVEFIVQLDAGPAHATKVIQLEMVSPDFRDRLYDSSGLLTSVTLDGNGEYSNVGDEWYISGGFGATPPESCLIRATHAGLKVSDSDKFRLVGSSQVDITDSVTVSDEVLVDPAVYSAEHVNEKIFTASWGTNSNAIERGFNNNLVITAKDRKVVNVGSKIWIRVTASEADGGTVAELTLKKGTTPINIAIAGDDNAVISGNVATFAIDAGDNYLTITPAETDEVAPFDLNVKVRKGTSILFITDLTLSESAEATVTAYVPEDQLDLHLVTDSPQDAIDPDYSFSLGWASGSKTSVHKAVIGETENKDYELTIADLDEDPSRIGTINGILHGGVPFECSSDWNTKNYILDLKGTFHYARLFAEPRWTYTAGTKLLVPYPGVIYGILISAPPVRPDCTYHFSPSRISGNPFDGIYNPGIILSRNQNWTGHAYAGQYGFPLTYWDLTIHARIDDWYTPNQWEAVPIFDHGIGFGLAPLFRFRRYAANPVGTYQFIARRGITDPNSPSRGWADPGYDRINRLTCRVNEA